MEKRNFLSRRAENRFISRDVPIAIIRFYQKIISPLFPANCRFRPSCSEYASEAISKFGLIKGVILAIKRLLRCHPLGGWGYDPVPDNFSVNPFKKSRSIGSGHERKHETHAGSSTHHRGSGGMEYPISTSK